MVNKSLLKRIEKMRRDNKVKMIEWEDKTQRVEKQSRGKFQEDMTQIDILLKYAKCPPKDNAEIKELFSALCWKNLGYCCHEDRECRWREFVIKILNIDPAEYKKEKEQLGVSLASRKIGNKTDEFKVDQN